MMTARTHGPTPRKHAPLVDPATADALAHARCGDPFAVLGPHEWHGRHLVRACLPGARGVRVEDANGSTALEPVGDGGVFVGERRAAGAYTLVIDWAGGEQRTEDPYAFGPVLGELDLHLIAEGRHRQLADALGAHVRRIDGVDGVHFAVWAPNAMRVSVVGDFNGWDARRHPMRLHPGAGVWEIFVPRIGAGTHYKFDLLARDGSHLPQKADPCARWSERPPHTASRVAPPLSHAWTDAAWLRRRAQTDAARSALSIYEVHVGSWMRCDGGECDWDVLADRLIPYVASMGFSHVELLPVSEHPFSGSWGYQPLGLFAPTARHGDPDAFARFVDRCHAAEIGVIVDWVPAHFPGDAHGLARFDGTALYEHADPREGFHHDWNTLIYNHGRREVSGFLIASALEWIERFHVDGLRVDAVASMLYRDYSRPAGEWVPNVHGGRENYEAIAFLRELNRTVHERCPGALVIAEESTAWPGVTAAVEHGGLGFDFKWNMGWMHDTLHYFARDPIHRRHHHDELSFGLLYAFSERFVLPISHDEVVHGKGSLFGRMPGDEWQRFANLRVFLAMMWAHPGKKLLFMGSEFGQRTEWDHDGSVAWDALDDDRHRGVQRLVRDLNRLYAERAALHELDAAAEGFSWVIGDARADSVYAFLRRDAAGRVLLAVVNLTPVTRHAYRVGVPRAGGWRELLNSDAATYGGSNVGNGGGVHAEPEPAHGHAQSLALTLPPLAALVLAPEHG